MVAKYKIVTLTEFNLIEQAICAGENIPRIDANGYKIESYLGEPVNHKHPTLDQYRIMQDEVTEKYCSGFITLDETWFTPEEI